MEPPKKPSLPLLSQAPHLLAPVEPLDVTGVRTILVGTGIWGLAFILLLPFAGQLSANGHLWWLWTCGAGFGLGLLGWDYCRRRARRLESDSTDPAQE